MFELDSGDEMSEDEVAPPRIRTCMRASAYLCAPTGHITVSCFALFYWYDAMLILIRQFDPPPDDEPWLKFCGVWEIEENFRRMTTVYKVVFLVGEVTLLLGAVGCAICQLLAFIKKWTFLLIPYIVFHVVYCILTVIQVAVHVYYTDESIDVLAVMRIVLVLITTTAIFIVLVFKKILETEKESPVVMVRQVAPSKTYDKQMPRKSDASFMRNPGARVSITSSHRIDNWVASTANVA
uniref:Uncharacterized protein n=1 Tax=Plectus sambesii TaxID=2011161 RepID=A0A914V4C6_9BILA